MADAVDREDERRHQGTPCELTVDRPHEEGVRTLRHVHTQMAYSKFVYGLAQNNVLLNRKVLSQLAMSEPFSFKALVDLVRFMRGAPSGDGQPAVPEGPVTAAASKRGLIGKSDDRVEKKVER